MENNSIFVFESLDSSICGTVRHNAQGSHNCVTSLCGFLAQELLFEAGVGYVLSSSHQSSSKYILNGFFILLAPPHHVTYRHRP